ncbi:hypothetical protein JR316_0009033 [Psilocybe cubensis]|uniref:Uncharacterized protein n=2 Tax=Psilocybe cubensis TaxID=181762 RepID=A0ACB8GSM6_PSICU|nr:hypothetical protein JR316_0009033 [Psilocybe cubensis]KAH9478576.1 hypothetical protein JR316_0009033 [Psilocybe cubensis]
MVNFPAPVGGTAYADDFAPSILFAVLYAALVPLMLYRMFDRRSRTILLMQTVTFSIERVVIFALRASQSRNDHRRLSPGLATYMQVSFGMGYLGIAQDLVNLLRCMLVNPTYGSDTYFQSPAAMTKGGIYSPPPPGVPDEPKLRGLLRALMGYMSLAFFAALVPGIIANSVYRKGFHNQDTANRTASLRFVSSGVTLGLCLLIMFTAVWSLKRFPKNSKRATGVVFSVSGLMAVVAVYRLSIMHFKTTSLSDPNPLNDSAAKATFYIFHVLPEWVAITTLLIPNIRKLLGTGMWGDFRWRDMTPAQVEKWKTQQAKREHERNKKSGLSGDAHDEIPLQEKTKNTTSEVRVAV